ncbi:hypothetical protein CES86_3313 [Brucella lupini]|jgi:hypothetical protein|uniref:Uncharacterized protein n=1 Tax=Brucella lupini TaxID=255457 RepID=A0A256GJ72_9HYPH|nr:hypothetical protein CES86_3313 [Brucella lupini]
MIDSGSVHRSGRSRENNRAYRKTSKKAQDLENGLMEMSTAGEPA